MKNLGLFFLALSLIIQGILHFTKLSFPYDNQIISGLALLAGVVLALHVFKRFLGNIGLFLLSLLLIIRSSLALFHFSFPYSDLLIALLGLFAGIFLMIRQ